MYRLLYYHKSMKHRNKPNGERNIKSNIIPNHKTHKKYLKAVLIILAALLVAGGIFYLFFGSHFSIAHKIKQLKKANVILITLDTLRADFVSAYETGNAETPNIDNLAAQGVLFEMCIAQTPLTLPSHTSILSGTYPLHHQVRDNGGFQVPETLEMISEVLKKKGFRTSAFIASYVLHSKWGINQGFDTYSDDFDLSKYDKISLGNVQKPAEEVLDNARQWLIENKTTRFFTWIHLYDPHTPYDPPSPFKEKYPKRPYRGEVEYMDAQLGLFFQFLEEQGIADNTLIILAADHGEGLGQHEEMTHGFFIYETTVRVPLIIKAPFHFPVQRIKTIVELVDLAPTILEALDIPIPSSYQGESLLGLMMQNQPRHKNTAYTESYYPRFHFGWSELKAIYYQNHWKYIQAPKNELYNLATDKNENQNLALKKSYLSKKAQERLLHFTQEQSLHALKPGQEKNLDKEALEKLAALGYLTTVVDTPRKENRPDPKGKVKIFNQLSQAQDLMVKNDYDSAIQTLENVLASEPHLVDGILQLGNAYTRKQMYDRALACFYRVLEQKPDYQAAMINVINSLLRLEKYQEGIQETQRFLKIFPHDTTLLDELGTLYYLTGEYDKALHVFQHSLDIEKTNPNALNRMAGVYIIKKDYTRAEELLKKAHTINPALRKLYFHLAQVDEGRGNIQQAIAHYKKELENYPSDYKSAYNLAEELRKQQQFDEAVTYYRQAMTNNPAFNIPYFMIAKYHLDRSENLDEAVDLCQKGIAIKPENKYTAFGYYILADIFSLKGDGKASQHYFQIAETIKARLVREKHWD